MYYRRGELRRKLYVQGCSMGQRARRGVGRRNQITEREKGPFQAAGNRYVGQTERVKILKFANKLINKPSLEYFSLILQGKDYICKADIPLGGEGGLNMMG